MEFDKIVVIFVILALILGGALPKLYINFKFIHNFILNMKEALTIVRESIKDESYGGGSVCEADSKTVDVEKYYLVRVLLYIRKHKKQTVVLCLGVIVGIVLLYEWLYVFSKLYNPKAAEYLLYPIDLMAFFGYWLCKTEKRKWQYSFLLVIIASVQISWKLFIIHSPFIITDTMLLVVWTCTSLGYYYKWCVNNEKEFQDLQQKLQVSTVVNEKLAKQYQALLEQRHDNKKHFNMLYHLNEEKQIVAMQAYLAQLEKESTHTQSQ